VITQTNYLYITAAIINHALPPLLTRH